MFKLALTLLLLTAVPTLGEERKLSGDEILAALSDKIVEGIDNGGHPYTQVFKKGGLTIYTVMETASSQGLWDVRGDQFCSQWPPGQSWTCYDVMATSQGITFVAGDGKTWPVTFIK